MSPSDSTTAEIVRSFLKLPGNSRYLGLALAVEEAVESLRHEMANAVYPQFRAAIASIPHATPTGGWKVTDECKQYKPLFWRRLYKDQAPWNSNQFSGVWIGRWKSERLEFEVCAEGWPAKQTSLDLEIRRTFGGFVNDASAGLWREDGKNSDPSRRISWHFDGDKALLIGDAENEVARIVDLLAALVDAVDQAENPTE